MTISRMSTFFLHFLVVHLVVLAIAQPQPSMLYRDCLEKGDYTTNSTYQANLNSLLTLIYTNTQINYGFYNFSQGENSDKVNAIALCRPDISPDACRSCIKNASDSLLTLCPNYKEAIGGLDNCMVRYTNRSISGVMEAGPYFWVYSRTNVSDVNGFNQSRMNLLDELSDKAAAGDSRYKYATGQMDAPNFQKIYALVQCTPDLSRQACSECLAQATGLIPQCCNERQGGRVITPSCNFRYEIDLFYNPGVGMLSPSPSPPTPLQTSVTPPPSNTATTGKTSDIARTLVIGSFFVMLL